jgi:hypothetical protein
MTEALTGRENQLAQLQDRLSTRENDTVALRRRIAALEDVNRDLRNALRNAVGEYTL